MASSPRGRHDDATSTRVDIALVTRRTAWRARGVAARRRPRSGMATSTQGRTLRRPQRGETSRRLRGGGRHGGRGGGRRGVRGGGRQRQRGGRTRAASAQGRTSEPRLGICSGGTLPDPCRTSAILRKWPTAEPCCAAIIRVRPATGSRAAWPSFGRAPPLDLRLTSSHGDCSKVPPPNLVCAVIIWVSPTSRSRCVTI